MNALNLVIVIALMITIGVIGTGIWSMAHGGEFDRRHSTQFMIARVAMQGVTLLLLAVAFYLAS